MCILTTKKTPSQDANEEYSSANRILNESGNHESQFKLEEIITIGTDVEINNNDVGDDSYHDDKDKIENINDEVAGDVDETETEPLPMIDDIDDSTIDEILKQLNNNEDEDDFIDVSLFLDSEDLNDISNIENTNDDAERCEMCDEEKCINDNTNQKRQENDDIADNDGINEGFIKQVDNPNNIDEGDDSYMAANPLKTLVVDGIDINSEQNRPLVLYIIKSFELNPTLWYSDFELPNSKVSTKAIQKISAGLRNQFNRTINACEIRHIFIKLRGLYFNKAPLNDDHHQYWFIENMDFLRKLRKRKYNTLNQIHAKENMQIAEIYKGYPRLWHKDSIDDRNMKKKILAKMLRQVKKLNTNCKTAQNLKKRIYQLRRYAIGINRANIVNKIFGSDKCSIPYEKYLEPLKFLEEHVGPFYCVICTRMFGRYRAYKKHTLRHVKPKFPCDLCMKVCQSEKYLEIHKRSHTNERPHACDICFDRFKTTSGLKNHQFKHIAVCRYLCEFCGEQFTYASSYWRHRKQSHMVTSSI